MEKTCMGKKKHKIKNNMGNEPQIGMMIGTVVTVLVLFAYYGIDWKKFKK